MSKETKECPNCEGHGVMTPCSECDNKGWVDDPSDGGVMCCPECNGDLEQCKECEGDGWIEA